MSQPQPLTPAERQRTYYERHKEDIKDKNKEKKTCPDCGALITRQNLARHKKTTSHLLKAKIIKYEFINDDVVIKYEFINEEAEAEAGAAEK